MPQGTFERIAGKIQSIWATSEAWPDFIEAMSRALPARSRQNDPQGVNRLKWVTLPNLSCAAVGGDPEWADEISVAWLLFNIAAHVFDSVEDQDVPDLWWREMGTAAGLNAASGLFFTATLALNRLYDAPVKPDVVRIIQQRFFSQLLQMSAGQHRDLTLTRLSLEDYWEIAAGKSGKFFGLASWAGARLACNESERLDGFALYGQHFGMLIQLLDDLQDFREIEDGKPIDPKGISRSFAAAYALDVYNGQERVRLERLLGMLARRPNPDSKVSQEVIDMLEQSGAALYLTIQVERHRDLAMAALEQAQPATSERDQLIELLPDLRSI